MVLDHNSSSQIVQRTIRPTPAGRQRHAAHPPALGDWWFVFSKSDRIGCCQPVEDLASVMLLDTDQILGFASRSLRVMLDRQQLGWAAFALI